MWSLLQSPVAMKLTFVLLHFLWQALLLVCLWRLAAALLKLRTAEARYLGSLLTLVLMAACPIVTFLLLDAGKLPSTDHLPEIASSLVAVPPSHVGVEKLAALPADQTALAAPAKSASIAAATPLTTTWVVTTCQPYLMLVWLTGILVLGARICLSYLGTLWLRSVGLTQVESQVLVKFSEIAQRLNILQLPPIAYSSRITQAMTVGLMRPMVLLPVAWMTEITPDVLEAVLAHELAHVRRRDLWINFLQRVMETVFFYHPAVWMVSAEVRRERESCCDEMAIEVTGQRLDYAKSLHEVAYRQLAGSSPSLAIPFLGQRPGELLGRVRRILGISTPKVGERSLPAGLMLVVAPLSLWAISAIVFPQISATAEAEDKPSAEELPADEQHVPHRHHHHGESRRRDHAPFPIDEPMRRALPREGAFPENGPIRPLNQFDIEQLDPEDKAMMRALRTLRYEVRILREQLEELKEEQQAEPPRRRRRARKQEEAQSSQAESNELDDDQAT
ncbi:M56 family metallopeptidase [Blastopirellula marina]|uniref:Peptidase M56 domain-containing protein n=1 Tax=Blastopirellula marina TaxID=124 RepID=A0A2S8FHE0_9BACT|nr:M56 family metallopeptidase [Blastopirellula marina]PQO31608.1 hypothetical protein C5Y98_19525 [Blastopirellula marina]PTL42915.1 hypothetical protein C5Y97_19535 [Blastopirellula marina]